MPTVEVILYFSGTGNTRFAAHRLATALGETRCTELLRSEERPAIEAESALGILFPIYAWGIPKMFRQALEQLEVKGKPDYVYAVCTCGDDTGTTAQELRTLLQKKGLHLDAIASVQMPETYVALPGFGLDTKEAALRKLQEACHRLDLLAERINRREKFTDTVPGGMPWLKSHVIKPVFYACLISDRLFYTTSECNHCGKCSKACPVGNIRLQNGQPQWKGHCTGCLACYHRCPKAAIHYGKRTKGKGQYEIDNLTKQLPPTNR